VDDGAVLAEPANDRGAHAAHAMDLGLRGRGHHTGEYLRVDGGRGGVPSVNAAPSRCHRVEHLLMPKAIGSTSMGMCVPPPGSRCEWARGPGLAYAMTARELAATRAASRGGSVVLAPLLFFLSPQGARSKTGW
jgi:hypothetical protein